MNISFFFGVQTLLTEEQEKVDFNIFLLEHQNIRYCILGGVIKDEFLDYFSDRLGIWAVWEYKSRDEKGI